MPSSKYAWSLFFIFLIFTMTQSAFEMSLLKETERERDFSANALLKYHSRLYKFRVTGFMQQMLELIAENNQTYSQA